MAGPYNCDICGQNEAAFLVGIIQSGDQQFLCPDCYALQGLAAAQERLAPEVIAELLGPMFVEGAGKETASSKRPRSRSPKAEAAPGTEPKPEAAEGLEEPPAAASDR